MGLIASALPDWAEDPEHTSIELRCYAVFAFLCSVGYSWTKNFEKRQFIEAQDRKNIKLFDEIKPFKEEIQNILARVDLPQGDVVLKALWVLNEKSNGLIVRRCKND